MQDAVLDKFPESMEVDESQFVQPFVEKVEASDSSEESSSSSSEDDKDKNVVLGEKIKDTLSTVSSDTEN